MNEPTKQTIVTVCGDAGGASAVAPVIRALRSAGYSVPALAYAEARTLWREKDIEFQELVDATTVDDAAAFLKRLDAGLVLLGTSMNGIDLEKRFLKAARRLGMPTLAVLDFWSNYLPRFADEQGRLGELPDVIAVMDDQACADMERQGFPRERLIVTGQPAFDELAVLGKAATPRQRAATREVLGIGADERLVVFASQPVTAMYGADASSPGYLGYTEHTVLALVSRCLERIACRTGQKLVLWVRPHPRENPSELQPSAGNRVRAVVSSQGDSRELALAADLVTGMTSAFLVEACLLGCPVLSLQPELRGTDPLPTNRMGWSRPVYHEEDMEPALQSLLLDDAVRAGLRYRPEEAAFAVSATRHVRALIEVMLYNLPVPELRGSL
jgi:hypothetical protein